MKKVTKKLLSEAGRNLLARSAHNELKLQICTGLDIKGSAIGLNDHNNRLDDSSEANEDYLDVELSEESSEEEAWFDKLGVLGAKPRPKKRRLKKIPR